MSALERLMHGVDAVVHLGGIAVEEAWEKIMPANVAGAYNVFEAARRHGVERIIVASSNHAVGFFPRNETIDDRVLPRPDGRYGLSKAFGEMPGPALCRQVRHGSVLHPHRRHDARARGRAAACDLDSSRGSDQPGGGRPHGARHALRDRLRHVGQQARPGGTTAMRSRLGYRPKHRSEDFADAVIAREPPRDPNDPAEIYQGGAFVRPQSVVHRKFVTGR